MIVQVEELNEIPEIPERVLSEIDLDLSRRVFEMGKQGFSLGPE
jgi:hypothetical protein